jgi:hypothetical protein
MFRDAGRNTCAMFDEVAREGRTWDDLCVEDHMKAFAGSGLCKPYKKLYDDQRPEGPRKATSPEATIIKQ